MQQAECFFIQSHFLQWGDFLIFASLYGYGIYLFILIFIHPVMWSWLSSSFDTGVFSTLNFDLFFWFFLKANLQIVENSS